MAMDTHLSLPQDLWEQTPPAVQAYIGTLAARVVALEALVHSLEEQVRTLQEQLRKNSRNSSRPPSSDPPQLQRPRRPRGQRRRGGQPGHPGHTRTLIPVEEVDEVVAIKPEQCCGCRAPLSGVDPTPFRHQVIEIPPINPLITGYRCHRWFGPACGETTRAPWPAGIPSGTYGPRVHATVALCTGSYRLSKRTTQQVMDDLFGVPMSVGTISQSEQATTEVVAEPVEEACAFVHEQAVAHLDETSWRQGGKRAWLWVAVTSLVTVFLVRMSRGSQVARELLGDQFSGILVTDRYSAYNWYPVRWMQRKEQTVRQQLREWYDDVPRKRGAKRQALRVETCFAPLLGGVVSAWQGTQLALALDATTLGDRFVVLAVSGGYRGWAIPGAGVSL